MKIGKVLKASSKLLALLASSSLLFGTVACSSDDDSPVSPISEPGSDSTKTSTADGTIRLNFSTKPEFISGGQVEIYNGTDLVDTVKTTEEKYYSINNSKGAVGEINVNDQLIVTEEKSDGSYDLIIVTHTDSSGYSKLALATTYTVKLASLITGAEDKTFTTKGSTDIIGTTINVGSSATDNFATIQGAFEHLQKSAATGDWTINVASGKYHERLAYSGSANVTLVGSESEYGEDTYVYWKNNENWKNSGQRARASFVWAGGNLTIKNMKFENTTNRTEEGNTNVQAETLNFDVAKELIVYNSSFYSYQDTLILGNNGGRAWFYKSKIAGDVDFIWGTADVALFENCKILCRADGIKNDAKIFASRTVATNDTVGKGFVLLNCDVEIEDGCKAAYGRSSGADTQASVINCNFTVNGSGSLNSALWGSASDTVIYEANGEMAVGYKDCNNKLGGTAIDTAGRLAKTGDISERLYNREYSGRWVIFNRVYNRKTGAYEFASSLFNINSIADNYGAPEDTSIDNIFVEPVYTKSIVGGKTANLTINTKASGLTYTYETSDKTLATVADGVVSTVAGADGTVTIKVTASNGKTDEVKLVVFPTYVFVSGVEVKAPTSVDMYALGTAEATVTPAEAIDQTLTWTATGDLRIVDPDNKVLVTELTTTSTTVQFESTVSGGTGTIKASAADTESGTPVEGSATVSVTTVRDYNANEAVAVNSKDKDSAFGILNFQGGKVGMWHDLYVHAIYNSTNGKIAASGERVQSRYGTIYIPVTANCYIDVTCQKWNDGSLWVTDFVDLGGNKPTTWEDESAETYKYHYKWELDVATDTAKLMSGADVLAMYEAATKDTNRSWADHAPDANAKYFGIVIPGADRYWTHITVTEDNSIAHQAASAELTAGDFDAETVTLDLDSDTSVTKTITASSSDNATPVITYSSDATSVASVDSSTGAVTLTGLVGTANITASVAHPTDSNVTKVTKSYKVIVKQTTAKESMYFDFSGTGIVGEFDYGVLSGSATYHGASYGINSANLKLKVLGPSRIYFAQMDYGSDHTVKNGEETVGTASTLGSGKCSKTSLEEAIAEGYVSYVTYTGSDATTLSITGSQYLSRFWVAKYEAAAVEITASDFASASATLDLNGTKTGTQTVTASATGGAATTIAYSSSKPAVATVDASTGAVTAVAIGRSLITATVSAEGAEAVTKTYIVTVKDTASPSGTYTLDFASGNIFDATTKANSIDLGIASLNAGSKNAYGYNGTQHGITFKPDNRVILSVKAGSVITITNCAYDKAYTLLVSTDGTAAAAVTGVTVSGTNGATVAEGVVSIPDGDGSNDGKTTVITIPAGFEGSSVTLVHTGEKTDYLHEISVAY